MVPEPTPLDDLEIIGYADALPEEALPRIVTPVFRRKKHHDRILLPPFRLDANCAYGGDWDGMSRWQSLIKTGNMTELIQIIPAQSDHQLWIDQDNEPRYERRSTAHKNLDTISKERVGEAQEALSQNDLDTAERLATTAFNADDRNIDALVVKAAVRKLQGKPRHIAFFASLAHGITVDHFTTLVENLLEAHVLRESPVSNICRTKRENAERELFATIIPA
ncbi:MAG: hypothetical protein JSV16_00790 [Candidatus Hydrogenedentota bacterium]|nr:MAG: hypothetical protein JSV16_00790 [Candidatus Hydrogenedentota bacterium]